jgi:lipopolysaccharide export system protein LptA
MPAPLTRLRRWVGAAAIAAVLLVGGVYFYARHRVQNALKQVPARMGLEIKQSATGFTVSKSEQGRTIFTIRAGKAIQFKQGAHAELHDVEITLYGRDSTRFDRIYGTDFEYDQQSGEVIARGETQIDLETNPQGLTNPDQAPPKDLKNPIHLKTSGLVFNQKTGDAYTKERIDFSLPQASGSAVGLNYTASSSVLTLRSQVNLVLSGAAAATITAARATITKDPHDVVLDHPQVKNADRSCEADEATLFLRSDNTLDRVLARGNVQIKANGAQAAEAQSEQLELLMSKPQSTLQTAILSGNVRAQVVGSEPMQANAGRMVLDFSRKNSTKRSRGNSGQTLLSKIRAEDNVKLIQHQNPSGPSATPQDLELTAPVVDFFLANGSRLDRSETSGTAQFAIRPTAGNGQQTLVTAGRFEANFDDAGQFTSVHGAPDVSIVSQNPGLPDRISTSRVLDATFRPGSGVESLVQQGSVAYVDGERKAWADRARYTPADQVLALTGSPRFADGGMTTTARTLRFNRASGDAFAEGNVKTSYSDLRPQPDGALLSSSSPIHVTAGSMSVHGASAIALYSGDARLWQDANAIKAQSIEFDRDHRSMVAYGSVARGSGGSGPTSPPSTVSTVLMLVGKTGNPTPIAITSNRLSYADSDRQAHFEGDVVAKSADLTITAKKIDAILEARGAANSSSSGAGKLDKVIAQEQVVVTQPDRRASGDLLTYTAADDKFVLTGGPPSIFDAERGKITGVSLTFFRHDDRVLVEGNNSSPTVTQTQVAR